MREINNNENLKEIIKEGLYLVDFYAEWCGPCKMIAPILEELEGINVIKVNVDENEKLATEYGVMSIPTLIFFKEGLEERREIGYKTKEELDEIISSLN